MSVRCTAGPSGRLRRLRGLVGIVLVCGLAACGGGGGGDAPAGGGPAGPTGLVPAAPAPGAVLLSDSRDYRPLTAGATWTYRQYARGVGPSETRTRHETAGTGEIREFDLGGVEADVTLRRNTAGDTVASLLLPVAPGRNLTISGTELTRELRANQQLVVFDSRVADVGDLDGDGRSDALDIAIWRVVVGIEDQVLPATGRPVRVLRVDERIALRTAPTGPGGPRLSVLRGSSWYAEGIGLVRSVSFADDGVTTDDDRRLSGFDAGSRGLGLSTVFDGAVPVVPQQSRAVAVGDQILTLESGVGLGRRDNRGRLLGTSPSLRDGDGPFAPQELVFTPDGVRLVTWVPSPSGLSGSVQVDAVGSDGRLAGPRLGGFELTAGRTSACVSCRKLATHPESSTLWFVSTETGTPSPGVSQTYLVLRRFGSDAALRGSPIDYIPPFTSSFINFEVLDVKAHASGVWVLLNENDGGLSAALRVVAFDNAGSLVFSRRYRPATTDSGGGWDRAGLVVDGASRWLLWTPRSSFGSTGDRVPRAVRLGPDGTPVGVPDTDDGLGAARLNALPEALWAGWPFNVTAAGGRWWISGFEVSSAYDDGASGPRQHTVIGVLDPVDEAALRGAPVLLRDIASSVGSVGLVLRDRVLWGSGGGFGPPLLLWR